jgi:hypothetical protein
MKPNKDVNAGAEAERAAIKAHIRRVVKTVCKHQQLPLYKLLIWIGERHTRTTRPGGVGKR